VTKDAAPDAIMGGIPAGAVNKRHPVGLEAKKQEPGTKARYAVDVA